jgi:hypothetical protein
MATPMDLIDADTELMTYGGIVDATTTNDGGDEPVQWCGASAAFINRIAQQRRPARRAWGADPDPWRRRRPDAASAPPDQRGLVAGAR